MSVHHESVLVNAEVVISLTPVDAILITERVPMVDGSTKVLSDVSVTSAIELVWFSRVDTVAEIEEGFE